MRVADLANDKFHFEQHQKIESITAGVFPVDVKAHGAVGDLTFVDDVGMTNGSATLTSASGAFSIADIGKHVFVEGAGVAGADLKTTISARISATQVTLTTAASTTVVSKNAAWGTDDSDAIQEALDEGGWVHFPSGKYLTLTALKIKHGGMRLTGASAGFRQSGFDFVGESVIFGGVVDMTVMRSYGTNDDGVTIMQAGPVIENLGFADIYGRFIDQHASMTLLQMLCVNRWTIRDCGFAYGGVGIHASKDSITPSNEDCAQWLIERCPVTRCEIGMDLNTFTGTVDTCWITACPTGVRLQKGAVNQATSAVEVRSCKFDIRDPGYYGAAYEPGVGIDIGVAAGPVISECSFETQPTDLSSFATTGIRINGDTTNTRVSIRDILLRNINKGIDIQTARWVRIYCGTARVQSALVTLDSAISIDTCLDASIFGFRSDTNTFPPIRLTANAAAVLIMGYLGGSVIGTTTVSNRLISLWKNGALRYSVDTDGLLRTHQASTGTRPSASAVATGSQMWDTVLKKPIWSDGTNWLDATGATV